MRILLLWAAVGIAAAQPQLLQTPTANATQIVFQFAGDLWKVSRAGGQAQRLTNHVGEERGPLFSPDGKWVAFTGEYDGNVDVFVVAGDGGVPRRLTYHPGADTAVGWTPDSKAVLFQSSRAMATRGSRLYTVAASGGWPEELPLHQAHSGAFSPDQQRIAYLPIAPAFLTWRMYRGGTTTPIWIADLKDSRVEKIPRENSNDFQPMWVGEDIYFLSDRGGPVGLYRYNVKTKKVTVAVAGTNGPEIKAAAAAPGAIVYEQFGSIRLFDLKTGKTQRVEIRVQADLPELRTRMINVSSQIGSAALSPSGARAVFSARGEIFTVPAEKGDPRNVTNTPGVNERYASWSPDGKWLAYFSDESGEYALHVQAQNGNGEVKKIALTPGFYISTVWSPDSRKISFTDSKLNYWYAEVEKGQAVRVDADVFNDRGSQAAAQWSPDSQWLVYAKSMDNRLRAAHVYSLAEGKARQITDGMSDVRHTVFDASGKYLYFSASTDIGPSIGDGLSTFGKPVTRSLYVAVLRKDLPSPFEPESDEEKVADPAAKPKEPEKKNGATRIDFEDLSQRILAVPGVPARGYAALLAGKAGTVFVVENPPAAPGAFAFTTSVQKYDLAKRKLDRVVDGVSRFTVSANGEKMMFQQAGRWMVASTMAPLKPGEGALKVERMELTVDPRAEWKQIYKEVWRHERDFFYDPGHHGYDLKAAEQRFEEYLAGVASRADLNYLFREMLRDLRVSHLFVGGGDQPRAKQVRGGLLGADYEVVNNRYRLKKVLLGENWNPQLRAPLTQPGVNAVAGEYILAINGRELTAAENLHGRLEGTAGQTVQLRIGPNADGTGAREVAVVPVDSESRLRNLAWIEGNRRKVDQMTNGRVAYVYLPDTFNGGFEFFNRYFYSQVGKQAVLFDERFNAGGALADYIVESANRRLLSKGATQAGKDFLVPHSIYGPKVMLINEYAGSGGDAMPYYFKELGVGPLVGKRTWGGLVRGGGGAALMDGGFVSAPDAGLYNERGQWIGENVGIAPDVEVEDDPALVRQGGDPQLERGVRMLLEELEKHPPAEWKKPPHTRQAR